MPSNYPEITEVWEVIDINIIIQVNVFLTDKLCGISFSSNIYWTPLCIGLSAAGWDGIGEQDIATVKKLIVFWECYEL